MRRPRHARPTRTPIGSPRDCPPSGRRPPATDTRRDPHAVPIHQAVPPAIGVYGNAAVCCRRSADTRPAAPRNRSDGRPRNCPASDAGRCSATPRRPLEEVIHEFQPRADPGDGVVTAEVVADGQHVVRAVIVEQAVPVGIVQERIADHGVRAAVYVAQPRPRLSASRL